MIVFTVCTPTQYAYTTLLRHSLPKDVVFKVGVVAEQFVSRSPDIDVSIFDLPNFDTTDFRKKIIKYGNDAIVAASKPFFAEYFLEQSETVIYVDLSVQFFQDLEPILKNLETADILLTPRITRPFGSSAYVDEKFFLNSGLIDASFFALKKSGNTAKMLKWWQERAMFFPNFDLCNAQNHDQLWLMYVPIFFDKVKLVKDKSWNVGLQNLHERVINKRKINGTESLFFLNFRELIDESLTKYTETKGANKLIHAYFSNLDHKPALFSIRRATMTPEPKWKIGMKAWLKAIINKIDTYPLYHS